VVDLLARTKTVANDALICGRPSCGGLEPRTAQTAHNANPTAARPQQNSMDFATFVLVYFGATVLFIGLLLFGEAPVFAGTPVEKLHYVVTTGWIDALEWVAQKVCTFGCMRGGVADLQLVLVLVRVYLAL